VTNCLTKGLISSDLARFYDNMDLDIFCDLKGER
jgi:hypothetical protein